MTDCSICITPVVDHPALGATGSHRSSCGHVFHPKCIAKWHLGQERSTCPLCRKVATDLEDCAPKPEADTESDVVHPAEDFHDGGTIIISRSNMDHILRDFNGLGITAGVEAEIEFDGIGPHDVTYITRYELQRIVREQGGVQISDAQWTHLTTIYPTEEAAAAAEAAAVPSLPPLHYIDHPCALEFFRTGTIPDSYYGAATEVSCDACNQPCATHPFYHCENCIFDVCLPCFVDGAARSFLQRMGL